MKLFRDFSVRTKFSLAFIINVALIITALLISIYFIIFTGLDKVENYYLENEFFHINAAMDNDLEGLLRNAKDYATWDDMYDYATTHSEAWLRLNITNSVPKNFKIDLILIFDAQGNLIYQYGDFAEFQIGKDLSHHPLIKRAFAAKESKGLCSTSKGIVYIASSQIMRNDESGPRNGTYLYAKLLDKSRLEKIKALTGMDLSIISKKAEVMDSTITEQIDRPKELDAIYQGLKQNPALAFKIYKPHYQSAFVYSILKDIEGEDIGMLEMIRPRKTIPFMRGIFRRISFWLFVFSIISVWITVQIISRIIFRPLKALEKTITDIQKTKDTLKRVGVVSKDELGSLAKEFNAMLDTLNTAQNKLIATQQELIKSEKMAALAELAMGTVHQINNPLSIVLGRIQLLARLISYKATVPIPDLERDLKIIEAQTQRAVEITHGLLRYAQPVSFRFERCDINELLKETISLIKEQFLAEKINIVENLKMDIPHLELCDRKQIQDVFINIMLNAKQAMPGGGELEISTDYDAEKDLASIKFKDNGLGIAPEYMDKLFTPFFSTKPERSGLGLAISYSIVKGLHGTIEIESKLGEGSSFIVKLPVARRGGKL